MVTLDLIRRESVARRYPTEHLAGASALVMFAAAFHGRQDAIHIADAGMTATCVDSDAAKLGEMVLAYPEGWEYVTGDAFMYARTTTKQWDVVSLDPPSDRFQDCADDLPLWCALARRLVILGTGVGTDVQPPAGWEVVEVRERSSFLGGVYWTVIAPC